jgi:hypothetical protein
MRLTIDISDKQFTVGKPFELRKDNDGNPRKDKQGGSNLPLYGVQLVALDNSGAETIMVSVPLDGEPPALTQGQSVMPNDLQAMPWVRDGKASVAYRATAVVPVNGAPAKGPAVKTDAKSDA